MARRRRRKKNPSDVFISHVQDVLELMQKVSDKASRLATHAPKDAPWVGGYLQEIGDKVDDLGTRFEEELEENQLI